MYHFCEECAYFTAARYFRQIERKANQIFASTGMTAAYSYILLYLHEHALASISQIAEDLGYERTSMSRMVKSLASKGLVEQNSQGRKTMISLSPAGYELIPQAQAGLAQIKVYSDQVLGDDKARMTALLTSNYQKLRATD